MLPDIPRLGDRVAEIEARDAGRWPSLISVHARRG